MSIIGEDRPKKDLIQNTYRMIFTGIGLAGCSSLVIIGALLALGFWLDQQFENANHLYTLILVLLSVPLTGAALLWVVRYTTKRFKPSGQPENAEEQS